MLKEEGGELGRGMAGERQQITIAASRRRSLGVRAHARETERRRCGRDPGRYSTIPRARITAPDSGAKHPPGPGRAVTVCLEAPDQGRNVKVGRDEWMRLEEEHVGEGGRRTARGSL